MLEQRATLAPPRPTQLLDIIGEVRTRWRMKLALRGALRVRSSWRWCCSCGRLRHGVGAVQPGVDHGRARGLLAGGAARVRSTGSWSGRCAARSPTSRWRCISKSTSRRCRRRCSAPSKPAAPATPSRRRWSGASSSRRSRRARAIDASRRVEQAPLRRYAAALAAVGRGRRCWSCCSARRSSATRCRAMFLVPQRRGRRAATRIEVKPGNASVPKGSDQTIAAKLLGFDAEDATLMVRRTAGRQVRAAAAGAHRERHLRRAALRRQRRRSTTSSRPTACARRSSR